jgi:release factor glutamine methyltransferase
MFIDNDLLTSYKVLNDERTCRSIDNLNVVIIGYTYDPSHDSYLLASRCTYLGRVVDLGCGSGYLTAKLVSVGNEVLSIDLSPYAVLSTKETLITNNLYNEYVHIIQGDGLKMLRPSKSFNAVFVNPPYLPVKEFSDWLGRTWSGGDEGVEVFLKMIEGVEDILRDDGMIYFISSTLSNIEKVVEYLRGKGFKVDVIDQLCFFMECIKLLIAVRELKQDRSN